jgi:hypothetical protein
MSSLTTIQISGVNNIGMTASLPLTGGALQIAYEGAAFTLLDDQFPPDTTVTSVTAALGDFSSGGTTYFVFVYTTDGTTVTPWAKSGGINTITLSMPSEGSTTTSFVVVAIPPSGAAVYASADPKIRLTRRPLV